jgi:hypothetical protein
VAVITVISTEFIGNFSCYRLIESAGTGTSDLAMVLYNVHLLASSSDEFFCNSPESNTPDSPTIMKHRYKKLEEMMSWASSNLEALSLENITPAELNAFCNWIFRKSHEELCHARTAASALKG